MSGLVTRGSVIFHLKTRSNVVWETKRKKKILFNKSCLLIELNTHDFLFAWNRSACRVDMFQISSHNSTRASA